MERARRGEAAYSTSHFSVSIGERRKAALSAAATATATPTKRWRLHDADERALHPRTLENKSVSMREVLRTSHFYRFAKRLKAVPLFVDCDLVQELGSRLLIDATLSYLQLAVHSCS